jgi:hypothetical protein
MRRIAPLDALLESAISALTSTSAYATERIFEFLEKRTARITPDGNAGTIENPKP